MASEFGYEHNIASTTTVMRESDCCLQVHDMWGTADFLVHCDNEELFLHKEEVDTIVREEHIVEDFVGNRRYNKLQT